MIDVRKRAEARAAMENKPIGASLETERQREKQAVFRQVENLDGSNIHKIAATVLPPEGDANRPLRVAAYCRVSTDDIDQALSIAMQIKAYKEKIMATPNWKYVGTYVDDGFSGTSTEHRHGFQKLMQDCMDGKIDMVITKAVSRFARNLLDCINWVEKLQNLDPPVRIFFEQESLDTMAQTSGIILFVLAMVAEEESHMKSEAMLLSLEWRFSHGRFLTPRMFGYDKVEVPDGYGGHKKILQINPAESRVVEWMYSALLSGMSVREIADTLTELAIPTGGRRKDGIYNTHWTDSRVISILRNEKHCGDVLARKTYTKSFKDHKARKNTGQKNKYYQAGHHDAIVTRTVWNAAQRILNSHRYGHDGIYLPMHIVDSGPLTGYISLNRSWGGFEPDDYYRVSQIAMGLIDGKLTADLEKEYLPEAGNDQFIHIKHQLHLLSEKGGRRLFASTLIGLFFFSFLLGAFVQLGKDLAELVRDDCMRFFDYSIIRSANDSLFYGLAERMTVTSPLPRIAFSSTCSISICPSLVKSQRFSS